MRNVTIRIIAAAMMTLALARCEAAGDPPGTPGSVTVYLHGRTEADISTSIR
jgi:hypothetical protein